MNARTLQALTRERPSTILTNTKKIVTVERTRKLVAVKKTSGSKDCSIRLSKNTITSAKEAIQKLIHQFENHPNREALQAGLKQNRAFNPFSEQTKEMIHSMGLRDLRDHSQHTAPQLFDKLDERHCFLYMRNMLTTFRQSAKTQQ